MRRQAIITEFLVGGKLGNLRSGSDGGCVDYLPVEWCQTTIILPELHDIDFARRKREDALPQISMEPQKTGPLLGLDFIWLIGQIRPSSQVSQAHAHK